MEKTILHIFRLPYSSSLDVGRVTFYLSFPVGIPQLIQLLKSDNEEVREAAALALANLTTGNPANAK